MWVSFQMTSFLNQVPPGVRLRSEFEEVNCEIASPKISKRVVWTCRGVELWKQLAYASAVPGVRERNPSSLGCLCVFVWPGSNAACWLNPLLSAKLALSPEPMTRNAHTAVLEETNGQKMRHYVTAGKNKGKGGEKIKNVMNLFGGLTAEPSAG